MKRIDLQYRKNDQQDPTDPQPQQQSNEAGGEVAQANQDIAATQPNPANYTGFESAFDTGKKADAPEEKKQ